MALDGNELAALRKVVREEVSQSLAAHEKKFWIEPKDHYNEHLAIREFLQAFRSAKNVIWKVVAGFIVLGLVAAVIIAGGLKIGGN